MTAAGWPWWAVFPVLAVMIVPGVLFACAVIHRAKRQQRAEQFNSLLWCRDCEEWMYGKDCESAPKYCGRVKP